MNGKDRVVLALQNALNGATAEELDATAVYLRCIQWIKSHRGELPEAERTLQQIEDAIAGQTSRTRAEVLLLTYKLKDLIEAHQLGLK